MVDQSVLVGYLTLTSIAFELALTMQVQHIVFQSDTDMLLSSGMSLSSPGTIDDQLRIVTQKALGDIAIPADWLMRFEHLEDQSRRDLTPLNQFSLSVHQSRFMICPVDFIKQLSAIHATPTLVPFR